MPIMLLLQCNRSFRSEESSKQLVSVTNADLPTGFCGGNSTKGAIMTKDANANNASVAMQQKSRRMISKYANLTPEQLHHETLNARNTLFEKCVEAEKYAIDVLVPYCEEIIRRYKMQGVAPKDRPNGKPTVDAYFKSIDR